MSDKDSEITQRRIQLGVWLTQRQMTKKQLAAQLGVSEASVYGWCSNTNIPDNRWQELKAFFSEGEEPAPGCVALNVEIPDEEWESITAGMPEGVDKVEAVKKQMLAFIHSVSALYRENAD